jgi:hypothetical protein
MVASPWDSGIIDHMINDKGQKMDNSWDEVTVRDLIKFLENLPGSMPVEMAMNQEDQNAVCMGDLHVVARGDGTSYVLIGE